jgi:hypothetical protein
MKALLLLALASGTLVIAGRYFLVQGARASSAAGKSGLTVALLTHALVFAWLLFASTYLFWIFPVAILLSGIAGYQLGRSRATLTESEFSVLLIALAASGIGSAVGFGVQPDRAFGFLPLALLVANYALLISAAAIGRRRNALSALPHDA